jgi:hypothetical protein
MELHICETRLSYIWIQLNVSWGSLTTYSWSPILHITWMK